ncbi:MAG: tetratricopeptide (TPR) repeat protein, partial [Planctomycetota bacterium]
GEQEAGSAHGQEAVMAYRSGDLETARTLWSEELSLSTELSSDERARLCYNIGNVCLRQDQALEAVGWYTAALRLRPRDIDTRSNLEMARLEAGLEAADRGDLGATVDRLLASWTTAESSWIALFGLLPLAIVLGFEALRGGRGARFAGMAALLVAVVSALPWAYNQLESGRDPVMVIAKKTVSIRSEPRQDADRVEELLVGEVVLRVDVMSDWTAVELSGRRRGWLPSAEAFALRR